MENISVHQRRFEAAVKVMRNVPARGVFVPSDDILLTFHTYHRQATAGACGTTQPWHLSKTEWAAWKALGDMSKEEAMQAYVEKILLILEMIPVTEDVSDLLQVLEPFYEVVEDETTTMSLFSGSGSSDDDDDDDEDDDEDKDVTRLTVANSADRGGSPACNGSISSLPKSPHSSLNTDEEGEELGQSLETSRGSPHRFLQPLTDDGDDVSKEPSEAYDDSEEEGSGLLAAAAKAEGREASTGGEGVNQDGGPQGAAPPPLCKSSHGTIQSVTESADLRGRELAGESVARSMKTSEGQIVIALSQLQGDMQRVLAILDTLEARAVSQVERFSLRSHPRTALENKVMAALLIVWPFVARFLVRLYRQNKRQL